MKVAFLYFISRRRPSKNRRGFQRQIDKTNQNGI